MRKVSFMCVIGLSLAALGAGAVSLEGLASLDQNTRFTAAAECRRDRAEKVKSLIAIAADAKDTEWYGSKQLAIQLLGEMRDPNAICVLLANFRFLPTGELEQTERWETQQYYVAANALTAIGSPSLDPLISEKLRSPEKEDRQLAIWVVINIEGKEQALSRFQRMAQTHNADERLHQLYGEAAEFVSNYKPTFEMPSR